MSASLVRGLPWRVYDNTRWEPWATYVNAFTYFQKLRPIDQVGYSIFIYRVTESDAARIAKYWQ